MGFSFLHHKATPLGDIEYDKRHGRRNRSRVDTIINNCIIGERALDIGCNAGYFSQALLSQGLAQQVDAIEYDENIVANDLKSDARFSLFTGDATNFSFDCQYDITIYGAVHHHIFALQGYVAAMRFWNNVIDHTESLIFMESGQLGEGSRWYWQRSLRAYYSSDEQYYGDVLCAVGARLKSVTIVGRYWLHGVRRWLLKIELWPTARSGTARLTTAPSVQIEQTFLRTIGSSNQELLPMAEVGDRLVHGGVVFKTGTTEGRKVFCKKYVATAKEDFESVIAQQVDDVRFVMPIGVCPEVGLVYPYIEASILAHCSRDEITDKDLFAQQLLSLYEFAKEKDIELEFAGTRTLKLVDIIDFHAANLFFDAADKTLKVIDLEFCSMRNADRNRLSVMKMLYQYGPRNAATSVALLKAVVAHIATLFCNAMSPPEQRILNRVVSVGAWSYMLTREIVDRVIAVLIPSYRQ